MREHQVREQVRERFSHARTREHLACENKCENMQDFWKFRQNKSMFSHLRCIRMTNKKKHFWLFFLHNPGRFFWHCAYCAWFEAQWDKIRRNGYCAWNSLPWWAHNFLNIDPFLMIFVPFERGDRELSNGTKIVKNGSKIRKLWSDSARDFEAQCIENYPPNHCAYCAPLRLYAA